MLAFDEACTISKKSGLFTATPIALFNNVHVLLDCILLCMKSLHCLSGCHMDGLCLHFDAVASDNARDLVSVDFRVVYFTFSCIQASRERKSIEHGHYPVSECGSPSFADHDISNRLKRIVRGARAQPYTQPWLGQVVRGRVNTCGASLISRTAAEQSLWAISAAHCFLGIADIVYHPKYGNQENDIALVRLKKPVTFNAYVRPLCMPDAKDRDLVHSNACSVCGYGATEVNGNTYPTTPHCYHSEIGNSFLIRRQVWNFNPLRSTVSAMDTFRYKGISEGDSGGPLTCKKDSKHFLTGVAYAKHVGDIHSSVAYNFFINVPEFVPWIRTVTKTTEKKVLRNKQNKVIQ